MKLVKLLAADSILKNDPDKEFDELRFAVDNDGTNILVIINKGEICLLYTSPSPRDLSTSRMPSSA